MKQAVVIYHGSCPDGWTGAWLMHKYLTNKHYEDVTLVEGKYGTPPPDVSGDVFLVDFCYEPEHLVALKKQAATLTILDHHQTALEWVTEVWGDNVVKAWDRDYAKITDVVVLDQNHSGAMLAMLWSGQHDRFVRYVEDRDLWRFRYAETNEVFAAITSYDYTLDNWDQISDMLIVDLVEQGAAVERYRAKLIADTIKEAFQMELLGHRHIWVAAAPYAIGSDVAGELAKRDPDRFAGYFVPKPDGVCRWGLRSTPEGLDVAALAQTRGGGGHKHASGFETPIEYLTHTS